jgi:hypothetical protein
MEFVMRTRALFLLVAVTLALMSAACGKKADVQASTAELEKAFQAPTATAPPPARPVTLSPSTRTAQDLVQAALASAKSDDYANGVIALQDAQHKPGVTAEQLMAVQRTMQAMTTDLLNRADRGDKRALEQLKAIERTRSQ